MQAQELSDIEASISASRLRSYALLTGNPRDKAQLIGAYQWNKRVSSALYPILQCLEVSLRNAIHEAATAHFGTPDWFDPVTKRAGDDFFAADMKRNPHKQGRYYRNGVSRGSKKGYRIWHSHHENMLADARKKLARARKGALADSIIAELTFGFWVGLFVKQYSDLKTTDRLWPHLEKKVFPHLAPADRRHSNIQRKLDAIKSLRNRLSHHEPVWKMGNVSGPADAISDLTRIVEDILFLIEGMSPSRYKLLVQSGKVAYFRGVCCEETLNHYLSGISWQKIDKRQLKRVVERSVRQPLVNPIVVTNGARPKFLVDLWLP